MPDTDYVVLLDEAGNEIGTAPKASVHGTDTALHLAFSCHVLDDEGRILVTRRALGITVSSLELALPLFRYRAVDASGIVEHEICPVYTARTSDELVLNPHEAVDFTWVRPEDLARSLEATPWAFSPWLVLQAQQLDLFTAHRSVNDRRLAS